MTSDIVYLSRVPWDSLYQRPQHLASGLARSFRVLYIDTPRQTFYGRFVKPLWGKRSLRPILWQAAPGLSVLSPAYVPFLPKWWPPPGQYILHRLFLHWAVQRLGIANPIVWTQDPRDLSFLPALTPRLLCYDCMDDYALIAPSARLRPALRQQEITLLARADLVFASSHELARRCAESNPRVLLVPNGVDADAFAPRPGTSIPADLAAIPRPLLGYVGSLASWLDFDLLTALATSRPQWSLVLVGPLLNGAGQAVAALRKLPNVHILGERPYAEVPSYLWGFDVCLIPFRLNDLTRAVNPVKFYEYMAAGRPVVATPLPELLPYQAVCALAADAAAFVNRIETMLHRNEGDDRRLVEQRLAVARDNSWEQRVQTMTDALTTVLREREGWP